MEKNSTIETLEKNYSKCPVEAIEKTVNLYDISELENIILQDKLLYGENGGVTFSGGEPLLQSETLSILMKKLKEQGINIAVESCMYVEHEKLKKVIDFIDLFIIDIKILNEDKAREILGGNINVYLENIKFIFLKNKNVIFRIPLIRPYIANNENLSKIYELLEKYKPQKVEIFKGHNLAKEKYLKLGLDYKEVETINNQEIENIKDKIAKKGIKTDIISF